MSFNVLVIPEDFRKDAALLRPIVQRLVASCQPRAKVRVCRQPLLGGVTEALKLDRIREIIERYQGMVDCFLLIVDRDGRENRRHRLDEIEESVKEQIKGRNIFLAENAWQEIEVWILAGMKDLPRDWSWDAIRQHSDPKEAFFEPYATKRGLSLGPFGGRQILAEEAARNYRRIRQLCPEDIGRLENRLRSASTRDNPAESPIH